MIKRALKGAKPCMYNLISQQQPDAKESCQLTTIVCPTPAPVSLPAEPFLADVILLVRGAEVKKQAGNHHGHLHKAKDCWKERITTKISHTSTFK